MLWLYINYSSEFSFYQIYDGMIEGIVCSMDGNQIYSLNCLNKLIGQTEEHEQTEQIKQIKQIGQTEEPEQINNIIDFNQLDEFARYNFTIKMKDNLIAFENNYTNTIDTFIFKTNFIEQIETNNKIFTPIFNYVYKKVKNVKMPNLSNELYDFVGTIEFKIKKIENNLLFVKEHNLLTNEFKQYYITDNLEQFSQNHKYHS